MYLLPLVHALLLYAATVAATPTRRDDLDEQLQKAIMQSDIRLAKLALTRGASLESNDGAALRLAGFTNQRALLESIIPFGLHLTEHGARVERMNWAVAGAAAGGHIPLTIKLVQEGAELSSNTYIAFRHAGEKAQRDWVRVFLNHRVDPVDSGADVQNRRDYALIGAAIRGHTEYAVELADQGANVMVGQGDERSVFQGAGESSEGQVINALIGLQLKGTPAEQQREQQTRLDNALVGAAMGEHVELADEMLGVGANLLFDHAKALRAAVQRDSIRFFRAVVVHNRHSPEALHEMLGLSLCACAVLGRVDFAKHILNIAQTDVHFRDDAALAAAAINDQSEILALLLRFGLDKSDPEGDYRRRLNKALVGAAAGGNVPLAMRLADAGAEMQDAVFDTALKYGRLDFLEFLDSSNSLTPMQLAQIDQLRYHYTQDRPESSGSPPLTNLPVLKKPAASTWTDDDDARLLSKLAIDTTDDDDIDDVEYQPVRANADDQDEEDTSSLEDSQPDVAFSLSPLGSGSSPMERPDLLPPLFARNRNDNDNHK